MIIKRKHFSVLNTAFAAMSVGDMRSSRKGAKQSAEEHEAAMLAQKKENKQLVDQLNNVANS
jgi:hypothetical protein